MKYIPIPAGLHELGASQGVQQAVLQAAERGAAAARAAAPAASFSVAPVAVTAGFRNEVRAGAVITADSETAGPGHTPVGDALQAAVAAIEGGDR